MVKKKIQSVELSGKKVAVFGPGDTMYPQFCKAVDTLEEKLVNCGSEIINESLKIDGVVENQLDRVKEWIEEIIEKLS
ncbi:MAG: flavodoxin domain-containing protein [Candidatus Omnitrophica bacterium]|nr:flavodoxin domain-containing protein [Candidatus Omnitrophota bacterium]